MSRDAGEISIVPIKDAEALAHLHAHCFERPWTAESFANLLTLPGVSALGAVVDQMPAGFILMRQAADEAEILTIGVVKQARRRGIARALFQAAIAQLSGVHSVFIEVDVTNLAALRFYEDMGFEASGRRKDYYQHAGGSKADALIMGFALQSSTQS